MKKQLSLILGLLLIVTFALSGCGGTDDASKADASPSESKPEAAAPKENIEITFADYGSSVMPTADAYRSAIDYIKETSGDRIKINYSPDAVLGNETEMIQQLMDGTMKMATLGTSTFSKFTPRMEVFQLPFLVTDYEKEQIAFSSPEGQVLLDTAEDYGLKIVGYVENGLRHFANNKRPINVPADLDNLKIRIVPSTMLQKSMELLGANPTPLNYGEIYSALQNKVIDGEEVNITSLYAMKHYETIDYVSEIGMYPFAAVVVFNLDYWNSLSEEDQKIITDGFDKGTKELFDTYLPEYEVVAKEACEEAGLQFNVVEDKAAFRELVQPVYDEYEAMDPDMKAFIDMMKALN